MPLQFDWDNALLLAAVAGAATAVPLLGPIAFGALGHGPAPALSWIAFVLAVPPLVLFLLQEPARNAANGSVKELTTSWRALWSAAFLAFIVQLWANFDPAQPLAVAHPPRLLGCDASNILLAALWGGSVAVAWRRPAVIWPQAIMFILLSASALVTSVWFTPGVARTFGLLFAMVLAGTMVLRAAQLKAELGEAQNRGGIQPEAPSITAALVLQQVWRDANGKEVQIAATYSYLWLADQFGHVGLGLMLSLLANKVFALLQHQPHPDGTAQLLGFLLTAALVCLWEFRAYHEAVAPPPVSRRFEADEPMIRRNAEVAALYMVIGAGMGWALEQDDGLRQTAALVAVIFVAVVSAKYWVRQKIIWQKAGLPYLFRLSDAQHTIDELEATALQGTIKDVSAPLIAAPSTSATAKQIVIAGPVGSGRTKLAAGIGTELAFRGRSVRYVSLDRMIEFADAYVAAGREGPFADDFGPANIGYWPWTQSEVLIIDDIGPVLNSRSEKTMDRLLEDKLDPLKQCLCGRHTVWVLGEVGSGQAGRETLLSFASHVQRFCEGKDEPTTVRLRPGKEAETTVGSSANASAIEEINVSGG